MNFATGALNIVLTVREYLNRFVSGGWNDVLATVAEADEICFKTLEYE